MFDNDERKSVQEILDTLRPRTVREVYHEFRKRGEYHNLERTYGNFSGSFRTEYRGDGTFKLPTYASIDEALAASGDYFENLEKARKRYHEIDKVTINESLAKEIQVMMRSGKYKTIAIVYREVKEKGLFNGVYCTFKKEFDNIFEKKYVPKRRKR